MRDEYPDEYGIDSLKNLVFAAEHGMDVFITLNKEMLEDREELEEKFKIKIRHPNEKLV